MSLITELKRRNVFRVGAAYMALAWVIVQITGAIVPALNLPNVLVPVVVWIGVIGFPCVLIISWVYELTPEGLKRESEVERDASITHQTGKRLDLITIVLVVFAIGFVVVDRLVPHAAPPATGASAAPDDTQSTSTTSQVASGTNAVASQPTAAAADDRSIAVLPFVNMSSDKEQEYFSDGISEELLNQLAKIAELKVSARTSSFSYKGKDTKISTIGEELHVANVLEGSVRKSGEKVRITAQLVRAADGFHLWSETYDRKIEDIFAVQDEIAGAVVTQLKVGSSRVDLQACKLEYSIVSPK